MVRIFLELHWLFVRKQFSDALAINRSRRPLAPPNRLEAKSFLLAVPWPESSGNACAVDIAPGVVAVGTDNGVVHVYTYGVGRQILRSYLTIPPPPSPGLSVASCRISVGQEKACVFVAYKRALNSSSPRSNVGVCCYDIPVPGPSPTHVSAPSARHDLDGRYVPSSSLCDAVGNVGNTLFTVVRY